MPKYSCHSCDFYFGVEDLKNLRREKTDKKTKNMRPAPQIKAVKIVKLDGVESESESVDCFSKIGSLNCCCCDC